jgi:hypothetical protein
MIDDLAHEGRETAHNGSTHQARRQAAKGIVAELSAKGIKRGRAVWVSGKGRQERPDEWTC